MSRSTRWSEQKQFFVDMFGGKCQECGYNRCLSALHFHHVDSSEKELWSELSGRKGAACYEEINHYPERFKLLCANCHIEDHDRCHKAKNTRMCPECKRPFVVVSSREENGRDKYCSMPCYQAFRLKNSSTQEGVRKRIEKRIDKTDGCWIWKSTNNQPYNHRYTVYTYPDGRHVYMPVKVVALYAYEGVEPNENREITMTCGNLDCVNPSHMNTEQLANETT